MRRSGKIALGIFIFLLVILTGAFLGLGFFLSPQSRLSKSDAIVAISGGETDSRTLEAVNLYQAGWASHIIFSGAALDPNSPSNARAMRQIALTHHVPDSAILLDEAAANTDQNAVGVGTLVRQSHYHKIILVTSPYHQRRASTAFRAVLGKDVTILNHSTTDKNWRRSSWWASEYSRELTFSELQKTIYTIFFEKKS